MTNLHIRNTIWCRFQFFKASPLCKGHSLKVISKLMIFRNLSLHGYIFCTIYIIITFHINHSLWQDLTSVCYCDLTSVLRWHWPLKYLQSSFFANNILVSSLVELKHFICVFSLKALYSNGTKVFDFATLMLIFDLLNWPWLLRCKQQSIQI